MLIVLIAMTVVMLMLVLMLVLVLVPVTIPAAIAATFIAMVRGDYTAGAEDQESRDHATLDDLSQSSHGVFSYNCRNLA